MYSSKRKSREKLYGYPPTRERVFYNFEPFLTFFKQNRANIRRIKIQPPELGKKGFGSIKLETKNGWEKFK